MKNPARRIVAPALFLLFCLSPVFPQESREAPRDVTRWYEVTLAAHKVGYMKVTLSDRTLETPPVLATAMESRIVFNRLGKKVETRIALVYSEDRDGRLVRFHAETALSNQSLISEGEVGPGEIVLKTTVGGAVTSQKIPVSGTLLGPAGIRAASLPLWRDGAPSALFQVFSVELNRALRATRTVEARESVTTALGQVPCLRLRESYAEMPIARTVWIDKDGFEVRTSDPSPFGEMESLLSIAAAEDLNAAGELPEEQYAKTIIRSNVRLPQARLIDSMTLALRHRRPEFGWPDLSGPGQAVLEKTAEKVVLRISRPGEEENAAAAAPPAESLAANAYLDPDDPAVREAAREAAAGEKDIRRKALRLERWVSEHMTFDLGIAFAPSRELIRDRHGTCVGYSGLLATLARAAGIPSRMLFGFVYLDGMWGGHAWVEMFIDGQWLPFDAAVNGPGLADAARFAFARSSLAGGPGELLTGGQQLYGHLDVEVLDYAIRGSTVRVPAGEPAFRVDGDAYTNPGLGLSWRKPEGFVFLDTDKVWPETVLVRMAGPRGERLSLLQGRWRPGLSAEEWSRTLADDIIAEGSAAATRFLGRAACRKNAPGRSVMAIADGVDAWIVLAEGPDAEGVLGRILEGLKLGPCRAFPIGD